MLEIRAVTTEKQFVVNTDKEKEYKFEAVIPITSLKEKYRDIILDEIEKNLKSGPAYYDIDEYTDQTLRQLAEETIREKALKMLKDEVPHGIYVEVEKMNERMNRLGISVSKKVGNSVVRHRITRLVRESYRLHENIFNSGLDIVVIARNSASLVSYMEIESALLHLAKLHHVIKTDQDEEIRNM